MTRTEILAQTTWTKTRRMQALFALGLTRLEVAAAMGVGYGFVQNVYTDWVAAGGRPATLAPAATVTLATFAARPFTRRFGIELEAFGVTRTALVAELQAQGLDATVENYNHTTRPHWKAVTDGSLTGADTFELVSPILEGRDGLDAVASAGRALRHLGARLNRTCGFHAHFDAAALTIPHLRRICLNYLRLEPLIDSLVAPSRRGDTNTYCRSIRRPGAEAALAAATTFEGLQQAINGGCRYHKLNLQSFTRHGTIEFRQHHGTADAEKVTFWLRFLHCLIDFSEAHEVPANFAATTAHLAAFCPREVVTYLTRRQRELAA